MGLIGRLFKFLYTVFALLTTFDYGKLRIYDVVSFFLKKNILEISTGLTGKYVNNSYTNFIENKNQISTSNPMFIKEEIVNNEKNNENTENNKKSVNNKTNHQLFDIKRISADSAYREKKEQFYDKIISGIKYVKNNRFIYFFCPFGCQKLMNKNSKNVLYFCYNEVLNVENFFQYYELVKIYQINKELSQRFDKKTNLLRSFPFEQNSVKYNTFVQKKN